MSTEYIRFARLEFDPSHVTRSAFMIAEQAHEGQTRKYTNGPYVEHPIAVAYRVAKVTNDEEMIAAALLHDVVEDTVFTADDLRGMFSERVVDLVLKVTNPECPDCENRKARKAKCREHLAKACGDAQTIKYADILENVSSIAEHDIRFAKTYLVEKQKALEVMTDGHAGLREQAINQVEDLMAWLPMAEKAVRDAEQLSA